MAIPIGCDHAGFELKEKVVEYLVEQGFAVEDYGTYSFDSVDYPDFGHKVAAHVTKNKNLGIVICGSGKFPPAPAVSGNTLQYWDSLK